MSWNLLVVLGRFVVVDVVALFDIQVGGLLLFFLFLFGFFLVLFFGLFLNFLGKILFRLHQLFASRLCRGILLHVNRELFLFFLCYFLVIRLFFFSYFRRFFPSPFCLC